MCESMLLSWILSWIVSCSILFAFVVAGQLEKLKVEQCKAYLKKNGLRLTGNKETLIQRIKEHIE